MLFLRDSAEIVKERDMQFAVWKPGYVVLGATYCTCVKYQTESAKDVAMICSPATHKPNTVEERLILAAIKTEAIILRMLLLNGGQIPPVKE